MTFEEYDLIPLTTNTEIKPFRSTDDDLKKFLKDKQ